ncbi:MAG: preprotein translocase subunit SecG [Firmicutes bacterium]|nr:preprotein translocase subunit SecG [Bacillota bacterium]
MKTFVYIFQVLVSIALIVVVTMQSSKGEGLGAIGGGAQLFFNKEKGLDALLTRLTTILAVVFMVSSIVTSFWH